MRYPRPLLATAALSCTLFGSPLPAQTVPAADGATELGVALRRLGHTKRVLMIGAHPDDENTGILASLALGGGVDAAYLSLTRGDGGQNVIGAELGTGLGLIRSEELLAARRLDGARQFFTRAFDFGFSKTADETLEHWPREEILADVVEVIRRFRPDIIIPSWTGTPRDGHGHHQVSGILAREAFDAAADPAAFPDQIARGLRPHRTARLMNYRGGEGAQVELDLGAFDRLLGRSHYQIAMASRSLHRSQDMGVAQSPGPRTATLTLERGAFPAGAASAFAGLDTTLAQQARRAGAAPAVIALLDRYQQAVAAAIRDYNPLFPDGAVTGLEVAITQLDEARAALDAGAPIASALSELAFQASWERGQVEDALWRAAGLVFEAQANTDRVTPGRTFELELQLWNGGDEQVDVRSISPVLPSGWTAEPTQADAPVVVAPGELIARTFRVSAPLDAKPTQAYFLEQPRDGDMYVWPPDSPVRTLPFGPAPVRATASVTVDDGTLLEREADAEVIRVEGAVGEIHSPVLVVPSVSVQVGPSNVVLPVRAAGDLERTLTVHVASYADAEMNGTLTVAVPAGWTVTPENATLGISPGAVSETRFTVGPPDGVEPGRYRLEARFESERGAYARGFQIIDYPHIAPHALYHDAVVQAVAADIAIADNLRIGYIEGAGDQVADALREMGATVELLDSADLATGELTGFDAIVTGIRAYEVRADIRAHNDRLLDYARAGGTLIVQYNQYQFARGGFAPFPLDIARPHGRVTDENADVTLLDPTHPILTWPNRIGPSDFEGWVQERGLYFADTFADEYTPLLEMNDEGEDPLQGSLITARVGSGHYVYTGIAFFRQLPAGVAGAYRLLANLVSLGNGPNSE